MEHTVRPQRADRNHAYDDRIVDAVLVGGACMALKANSCLRLP